LAVVGLLAAVAIMIHPFRIPTTGQIVIAASWSPPTYLDPGASPSLTQELLVQLHRENPELIPAADLWEKSITRQASFSGPLFSFWCAAVSLACSAGWYFIPRWLNRLFYPPRRSRYEDDSAK
jgi:hypothetical protein